MKFWLGGLFAIALVAQAKTNTTAAASVSTEASRARDLVCSMSVFFSVDADEKFQASTTMDGRGLVSCRSEQGFSSEFPVLAELDATLPAALLKRKGEIAISGNTSQFVVARGDASELEDSYTPRVMSWNNANSPEPKALFRGLRHDVMIEMKVTSRAAALAGLELKALRLHFDEGAPDLD